LRPRGTLETPGTRGVVAGILAVYSDEVITCGKRPDALLPVKCYGDAGAGSRRTGLIMSEPFRPYEKLVEITVFGKKFQVPERNSLLRCFQFISPETIPYGRFCWNQDCQYCRVTCQLPDEDEPHEMLSCKFIVMPGMEISEMSQELKWCLRAKLPSDTPVSS
jgi:hypothetical protein